MRRGTADEELGISLVFNHPSPRPYVGMIYAGGLAELVHVEFENGEPTNNRLQVKDQVLAVNNVTDARALHFSCIPSSRSRSLSTGLASHQTRSLHCCWPPSTRKPLR